jgi:hypothetical protein
VLALAKWIIPAALIGITVGAAVAHSYDQWRSKEMGTCSHPAQAAHVFSPMTPNDPSVAPPSWKQSRQLTDF